MNTDFTYFSPYYREKYLEREAVSYTHLDVYKRQTPHTVTFVKSCFKVHIINTDKNVEQRPDANIADWFFHRVDLITRIVRYELEIN